MADEAKTPEASSNPELEKLEKAVNEAVSEDSPESDSQDQASEEKAPEYGEAFQQLAEKKGFKSVDDLVKAYENAESMGTRTAQQLNELMKEVKSLKTPQSQDDPYKDLPKQQREALDLLGKVIDERLEKRLQPLQQDIEVRTAQQEIQKVRESYPTLSDGQLEQAVGVVEKHPSLSLDEAVRIVTYEDAQAVKQANASKAEKTKQKSRAFVESARGSKTGGDIDYSKLSLEELENILPKAGQYVDSKGSLRKD